MLEYWLWDLVDVCVMRKKRLLAMLAIGERSRGELASELGISSRPWLSMAYLSPLMAQGYIVQIMPKNPWGQALRKLHF